MYVAVGSSVRKELPAVNHPRFHRLHTYLLFSRSRFPSWRNTFQGIAAAAAAAEAAAQIAAANAAAAAAKEATAALLAAEKQKEAGIVDEIAAGASRRTSTEGADAMGAEADEAAKSRALTESEEILEEVRDVCS